jgi:hypothetical protein
MQAPRVNPFSVIISDITIHTKGPSEVCYSIKKSTIKTIWSILHISFGYLSFQIRLIANPVRTKDIRKLLVLRIALLPNFFNKKYTLRTETQPTSPIKAVA